MKRLARCSIVLLVVAVAALAASTAFAAQSPDALFSDAIGAYNQKNYDKAAVAFENAAIAYSKAKKTDKAAQAAYNQGLCHFLSGEDPRKAAKAFLLAAGHYDKLKDVAHEISARMNAAEAFFRLGAMEESARQCLIVQKKAGGNPELEAKADEGLGRIALKKGDFGTAVVHFDNALGKYAKLPSARLRMMLRIVPLRVLLGDIKGALDLCAKAEKEALDLAKDEKTKGDGEYLRFLVVSERARIENLMGWFDKARESFEAAMTLADSGSVMDMAAVRSAEMNQGKNTMQLGNFLLAREIFERLLAEARKNGQVEEEGLLQAQIGQIERMDGRFEKALSLFRQSENLFRKAGLKARETEILGRIANLYYEIGMWNESLTNSTLVFRRALAENNLESVLTSLMRIFRIEAGKVTGLSGKLDYRTAQGLPWRGSLSARSVSPGDNVEEHKDQGVARAWKNAVDASSDSFIVDPSIEGFEVIREVAAFVNWTKVRLQASYYSADARLRLLAGRIRSANKAAVALRGLIEGNNAEDPEYRNDAIKRAFSILRNAAGETLLAGKVRIEDIQTSGLLLEGPEIEDKKPTENRGLANDLQTLASLAARCSISREAQRSLSRALLSGGMIPVDLEVVLRKAFLAESERRLSALFTRLASPDGAGKAQKEIAESLFPLLEMARPSLKREMGKMAESRKFRGYFSGLAEQSMQKISADAEALAMTLRPEIVTRIDTAADFMNVVNAWRRMQLRLLVASSIGIIPERADTWDVCLKNCVDALGKSRVAFKKRFTAEGKKEDLEKVRVLLGIAMLLGKTELSWERSRLSGFLPEKSSSSLEFDDEVMLRELIGRYDWDLGSPDESVAMSERILDMLAADRSGAKRRQLKAAANPEMQWRAYGMIGKAALAHGDAENAIVSLETALDLMEQINPLEGATSQATSDRLEVYRKAIEAAFLIWERKKDEASAERLWMVLERMKSRQWRELLATTRGTFLASLPKTAREELNLLRSKLTAAEGGFRYASFRGDREKMDQYSAEINTYRLKINDLTAGKSVDAPKPQEASAVRRLLPQDWNVANYYISDTLSFCLLLSNSDGLRVVLLPLDYDSFFGYFVWMRYREGNSVLEFDEHKIQWMKKNRNTACGFTPTSLYHQLFEPVANQCGTMRKLLIIPHDILHIFPMETLVDSWQGDKPRFLVEDWTLAELPSTFLLRRERRIAPKREMLIVANPMYGALFKVADKNGVKADVVKEWSEIIRDEKSPVAKRFKDLFQKKGVLSGDRLQQKQLIPLLKSTWNVMVSEDIESNLLAGTVKGNFAKTISFIRGTQDEAEMIASLFNIPKDSEGIQIREHAAEKRIASLPIGDYRLIHFACHGYDRGTIPDLQPGIALSAVDDPENDSFLQMGEMAQLPWNADIVTLSACETGLGDLFAGDGMVGLSTVLLAAGNKGAVLSRWTVPDESAPYFMKSFYNEIRRGGSGPEAVRKAQISLIGDKEMEFSLPRHWAVFKYVGIPW